MESRQLIHHTRTKKNGLQTLPDASSYNGHIGHAKTVCIFTCTGQPATTGIIGQASRKVCIGSRQLSRLIEQKLGQSDTAATRGQASVCVTRSRERPSPVNAPFIFFFACIRPFTLSPGSFFRYFDSFASGYKVSVMNSLWSTLELWCPARVYDLCVYSVVKVVPRYPPADDVVKVSRCRRARPWRWHGSGGGCDRRLVCCTSISGLTVHGMYTDDCDHRVRSYSWPRLLAPTVRSAMIRQRDTPSWFPDI